MTGAEFRNSDRRHSANLPGPQGLREEATRLLKNPYCVIEVKDLRSGDGTAVALRPA
jgi:hypothetical protein